MSKKKRFFIVGGFCLLLAITGILNIVLNNSVSTTAKNETVTTANFFSSYRNDRTSTYEQEMLYLSAIISSTSSSSEAKANAETEQTTLMSNMKLQTSLESLIKAKGFSDVVVSALTNNLSVIVSAATLTETQVAQIVDIVLSESNYGLENIKIIPVE